MVREKVKQNLKKQQRTKNVMRFGATTTAGIEKKKKEQNTIIKVVYSPVQIKKGQKEER
jgi:hypothetical protein